MLEAHRLGEDDRAQLLWVNIALSLAAGVAIAALGRAIGSAL
jgi:fluoride ion exporter CrcB/FEX